MIFSTVFEVIKTLVTTYFNLYKTIIETIINVIKTVITTVWEAIEGVSQNMIVSPNVSGMETIAGMQPSERSSTGIARMMSAITSAIKDMKYDSGDIVIPVYLGGTMLDEVIVSAQQRANLRSGGR